MRNKNLFVHYGSPLLGSLLAVATIAAFILGLGGEEFRKGYATLVLVHAVYITFIAFLVWLVFDVRTRRFRPPVVARVVHEDLMLLCRPVQWLGIGAAVSVYYRDGDYERLVGSAEVVNIQQNGFPQVQFTNDFTTQTDRERASEELSKIDKDSFVIKPSGFKSEWL